MQERGFFDHLVFESVAAPQTRWTGTANDIIHPRIMRLCGGGNRSAVIQKIIRNCPPVCMQYFEQCVQQHIADFGLTSKRDLVYAGRQVAYNLRTRVTPLLFYAWFMSAQSLAFQLMGKKRGRAGQNVEYFVALHQSKRQRAQ